MWELKQKKSADISFLCDQSIVLGEKERGVDGGLSGGLTSGGLSAGGCANGAEDEFDRSKDYKIRDMDIYSENRIVDRSKRYFYQSKNYFALNSPLNKNVKTKFTAI